MSGFSKTFLGCQVWLGTNINSQDQPARVISNTYKVRREKVPELILPQNIIKVQKFDQELTVVLRIQTGRVRELKMSSILHSIVRKQEPSAAVNTCLLSIKESCVFCRRDITNSRRTLFKDSPIRINILI